MLKCRYNILGVSEVVLILALIAQGPTAQAFTASGTPNVGPVLLGVVDVAKKKKCSKCRKEYFQRYYKANSGKIKEYGKKWRADNAEWVKERGEKYRLANPEYAKEYHKKHRAEICEKRREYHKQYDEEHRDVKRQYHEEHRAERAEYHKRWRTNNREKIRAIGGRRRARKLGVSEQFTDSEVEFVRVFWGNRCAVCGRTKEEEGRELAIDHWHPLSKGNPLTMKNAVLLCMKHNCRKAAKEPSDVFDVKTVGRIERKIKKQVTGWEAKC